MRWFKHMTDTKNDEKIVSLISKVGLEGYGFYWSILEIIGKQMEKDSEKCSVTYPLPYLSRQLYCHHHKVSNLLGNLEVTGLMIVSKVEVKGVVNYTISCPNLLKYRDEYSSKKVKNRDTIPTDSRQTPDQEQIQIQNTDTDTDIVAPISDSLPTPPTKKAKRKKEITEVDQDFMNKMEECFPLIDVEAEANRAKSYYAAESKGEFNRRSFSGWLRRAKDPILKVQDNYTVSDAQMEIIMAVENKIYERELASGNNKKGD